MRQMLRRIGLTVAFFAVALVGVGCNKAADDNKTASLLTITQITALGPDGTEGTVLASDVITIVAGQVSFIEDQGSITVRNIPINPDQGATAPWQDVAFTRARVNYTRAEGRNNPGTDVPYPFEMPLSVTVPINTQFEFPVLLVLARAKQVRPLVELWEGAIGENQILATAHIELFGADLAGHPVYLKGTIAVHFANWADD